MESIEKHERGIVARIEDIGEIKRVIRELYELEIFDKLSKHHELWNIEMKDMDEEKFGDYQWDMRSNFMQIQDRIDEISSILYRD